MTFSLDGPSEDVNDSIRGKGAFHRAVRGLEYAMRAKARHKSPMRLICSHTLMRPNYMVVDDMVELCTQLGFQNLIVAGLRRMGGALENYADLAITEEEKLQSAELVARRLARARHCNVQFDALSLLGKAYINAKYGPTFFVQRAGCDAVTSKGYIQPDGALFPCQDIAKLVGHGRVRDEIRADGVAAWNAGRYAVIPTSTESLTLYANYTPCRSCPALGVLCTPCPLAGLRGRSVVQESCQRVMERAASEGISLQCGLHQPAESAMGDRLVQSPAFRRSFFGGRVNSTHESDAENVQHAITLRDTTLMEIQGMLRGTSRSWHNGVIGGNHGHASGSG